MYFAESVRLTILTFFVGRILQFVYCYLDISSEPLNTKKDCNIKKCNEVITVVNYWKLKAIKCQVELCGRTRNAVTRTVGFSDEMVP